MSTSPSSKDPALSALLSRLEKQAQQERTASPPGGNRLPVGIRLKRMESLRQRLQAVEEYLRAEIAAMALEPPAEQIRAYSGGNLNKFREILAMGTLMILQAAAECGEE